VLLVWAVSCDAYEPREDGTVDIYGAGFDTYRVDELPAELDLDVLLRLLLSEDEEGRLEAYILGPDTVSLGDLQFPVEPDPGPMHRQGFMVSQTEVLRLRFLAETEGVYSLELYVDHDPNRPRSSEHRHTFFFHVREGPPEGV
jgi:hypothetical protein